MSVEREVSPIGSNVDVKLLQVETPSDVMEHVFICLDRISSNSIENVNFNKLVNDQLSISESIWGPDQDDGQIIYFKNNAQSFDLNEQKTDLVEFNKPLSPNSYGIEKAFFSEKDDTIFSNLMQSNMSMPISHETKEVKQNDSKQMQTPNDGSSTVLKTKENEINKKELNNEKVMENRNRYTERDKRIDVALINHHYSRILKGKSVELNRMYFDWKKSTEKGDDQLKTAHLYYKWEIKNEEYRKFKQAIALEVYEKVQPLFQKIVNNEKAIDLHGQGIHSGSALYVLKTKLELFKTKKMKEIIVDIGCEKDGEWHILVSQVVKKYLKNANYSYEQDKNNHYLTIRLN
ncbi:Uncharacterized protein QTN25_002242 [Entamoeba marina]